MIGAKSYFARMNENRGDTNWLSDDELLKGTEKFLKLNNYSSIQYNRVFAQEGGRSFSSPIVASRRMKYDEEEEEEEDAPRPAADGDEDRVTRDVDPRGGRGGGVIPRTLREK